MILSRDDTVLVAIDFQEKLMPVMNNVEDLADSSEKLFCGLKVLEVPHIVTQQYTKGLGETVTFLADAIGEFEPVEKTNFSAFGAEGFEKTLRDIGKSTVVLCGIEAHICVLQTALDLKQNGYNVYVPVDCISSRKPLDCDMAINRMAENGCIMTTCEAVLYELLGGAKADGFREISKIIK